MKWSSFHVHTSWQTIMNLFTPKIMYRLEQNFGLKRPYGYFIQILLHAKGSYLRNINPPLHPAAPSSILATNIVIIEFLG